MTSRCSSLVLAVVICQVLFYTEAVVADNCTGGCTCTKLVGVNGVHAKCSVADFKELSTFIRDPLHVKSLEIVASKVETVPIGSFSNFTNLLNLSLSNNSIRLITDGAFSGLNRLQRLDLSGNQLRKWEGNSTSRLPSLMYLDLSGNLHFKLPTPLLKLRMLKEIKGVTWNEPCANCLLVKNYTLQNGDFKNKDINIETAELRKGEYLVGNMADCRLNKLQASKEVVEYAKHGFFPQCLEKNPACFEHEIRVTPIHRCWDLDNKILYVEFLISPIAMILNLTVIFVTLTTRVLRRNVTMFLTSNMALSDFMISLYTLILVSARLKPYTEFLLIMNDLCNVIGFMWLTGQIVSIKTSIILTVERFLAVVYCLKPSVRVSREKALGLVVFTWCLSVGVAILPLAKISVYTGNTYCVPIRPIKDIPHSYELSIGLSLWGMLLYLITIPLYIKIFLDVKKTSERAGVKRDGKLARRIGTMVLSNMLFFLVPIFIAFLWLTTNLRVAMSPQNREILTGVLPTVLFSFNSLINPLLYAFRAEKFRKAIKLKIDNLCLRKGRSSSLTNSVSHQVSHKMQRGRTLSSAEGGSPVMIKLDPKLAKV
ncbi:putative glycoprotein hormone G-protein coupled receptor isoform X2 [Oculina patagonica]